MVARPIPRGLLGGVVGFNGCVVCRHPCEDIVKSYIQKLSVFCGVHVDLEIVQPNILLCG